MNKKVVPAVLLLLWSFVVLANLSTVSMARWPPAYYIALGLALLPVAYAAYNLVRWGRRRLTARRVVVIAGALFTLAVVTSTPVAVADTSCQYVFAIVGFWCIPFPFPGVWFASCFPVFGYVPTGNCDPNFYAVRPAL